MKRFFHTDLPLPSSPIDLRRNQDQSAQNAAFNRRSPALYYTVFGVWILALLWFEPRLLSLLEIAHTPGAWLAMLLFILFIDFAWLYGIYNIAIVGFALWYRWTGGRSAARAYPMSAEAAPAVAILYTTCNDFVEESVLSCVHQDYPNFTVYLLDDSTGEAYQSLVDGIAERFPDRVRVVRRSDRKAFKAGNMNHGLATAAIAEPYFAIADADEILPSDFLQKLVPILEANPGCGFVQANHRANPRSASPLGKAVGVGIDVHWKWYQPLRNRYGFVMFLGHGAVLRRRVWAEIGGFPDIVSEDLGFAIQAREKGYTGYFAEDVVCYEDFPEDVRAFRIRHMKWTRGTSEFLHRKMGWLLRARNVSWTEKLDILFPTLNLPLTLVYFLFMLNANLALPYFFGEKTVLTFVAAGQEFHWPMLTLPRHFESIYTLDFYLMTMLTFFAPVLCFVLALARRPLALFRFLSHSTALYASLGTLSTLGVLSFLGSGCKAFFLVTGDKNQEGSQTTGLVGGGLLTGLRRRWRDLLAKSHPDHPAIQTAEVLVALGFAAIAVWMFQISFFGLCLGFLLLPLMHHLGWEHWLVKRLVYLPFLLILLGVGVAGMSIAGMQSVFFGYGFHF